MDSPFILNSKDEMRLGSQGFAFPVLLVVVARFKVAETPTEHLVPLTLRIGVPFPTPPIIRNS